jgi:drug/metabolite transporter (DMT)-like permease
MMGALTYKMMLIGGKSARFWAIAAIVGANLIWGINYVVSKMVVKVYIDPAPLTMYRILVAAGLMWLVSLFYPAERVDKKDLLRLFFAALFGVTLNQSLFIHGIAKTTPIDASIIVTLGPILVLLLSSVVLHDRITASKVVGITIGGFGAISLVAYSGAVSFGKGHLLGNVMILCSAISYALYLVTVKPLMAKYTSLTVIKWVFLFGTVQMVPWGLRPMLEYNLLAQPLHAIVDIAFIVVGATFLAYLFISFSLAHIKATTVSIFSYTQPVVAAAFALLLGVDSLGWVKVTSMLLVCLGVYISSRPTVAIPVAFLAKKS